MIDRYCTPAMSAIWDRKAKTQVWLDVEVAICRAHAALGTIPSRAVEEIASHAGFTLERCDELERETRHDLMAFVRCMSESVDKGLGNPAVSPSRFIHMGVTSYDVIDTSLGIMLRNSADVLLSSGEALLKQIGEMARTYADTPQIGRTHGIHAEPITFGFKLAGWYGELARNLDRLRVARAEVAVGKVSGAVGVHAIATPELEKLVCEGLGLTPDPATTQIISRDRHANFLNVLALLGAGLERIATELRNLQRTEILEVQEAFAAGQTGSSAMPHKRNPWNSETVCGLARLLRANAHAMLESVATWHERDLTNSSLERVVFPDSCQLADFMLNRLLNILNGLQVFPERMKQNLEMMGDLVFSEHVMIALVAKGMKREDAYKVAQRNAALAWDGADFKTSVANDPDVTSRLSPEEVAELFSLDHHLRHASASIDGVGIP